MADEDAIQVEAISSDEEFDEDDDSESSTDIDAKLEEEEVFDDEFFKCYSALKKKDSKIYDKNFNFFSEPDSEQANTSKRSSKPKMTLLDHELQLKEDDIEEPAHQSEPDVKSFYEKELDEIKNSIAKVGEDIESDEEFLTVKGSKLSVKINPQPNKLEEDELGRLTEEEKFLRDYIINKRYLPSHSEDESNNFFSKNLDDLPDGETEDTEKIKRKKHQVEHRSDEKDFEKLARIPRHSTKTIRDLVEKREKKEKRLKKLEKEKKRKKAMKDADCEDIVGDLPTKFHYIETEPVDCGLSAEELLMAPDEEIEKRLKSKHGKTKIIDAEPEKEMSKRKKKKRRSQNHKKFSKVGVAPDRLLSYGLSKTRLKKSKLL